MCRRHRTSPVCPMLGRPQSPRCDAGTQLGWAAGRGVSLPGAPFAQACALRKVSSSTARLAPGKTLQPTSEPALGDPRAQCGPPAGRDGCTWPSPPVPARLCSLPAQHSFRVAGVDFVDCGLSENVPDLVWDKTGTHS